MTDSITADGAAPKDVAERSGTGILIGVSGQLRAFRIGPIRVDFPVILAPMAGYTDLPYRLICREHGAEFCTTEMMLAKLMLQDGKLRRRLIALDRRDHPVAAQLLGNDPDELAAAARVVLAMGFDAVDLNFACPVRKALARRRGGYLMSQPDRAIEIIRAVIAAVDGPVTVKLRQKFRQDDDCDAFWRISEAAFDAGAAAVCVHARSVEAKYTGPADRRFIAEVKRRFADRTIIASGDVLKPADALSMLAETHADAVAVARGALGNPWFFRQVRDLAAGREPHRPGIAEQRELLERHFADACRLYGPRRGPRIMRKFGIKYARMHSSPRQVRAAFVQVKAPDDWQAVLDTYYTDGRT